MNLYRITDEPDLVKDMDSKAILNTNYAAYLEYINTKKMNTDVETLKVEMSEIKDMLSKIISALDK